MPGMIQINDEVMLKKGFSISTDKSLLNLDTIHHFLCEESYWAKGIPVDKVKTCIENSICYGVYYEGAQIGFARVISDKSTFAYIADVFILSTHRKLGLSKWLVQTIINSPDLQGLRRWLLATVDAHGLYKQLGFTSLEKPERFMQKI